MAWQPLATTLQAQLTETQELYQTPANKLDAWIERCLMPNGEFNVQVGDAIDRIGTFLKQTCFKTTKVHKVVKGGSSGKGTTLKNGSDADLVVFLSCFQTLKDQREVRSDVISEIYEMLKKCSRSIAYEVIIEEPRDKLDPMGQLRQPRSLTFSIRSRKVMEAIDVDVLPAYDILGQVVNDGKPDPEIYNTLIKAGGDPGDFSTCFTELQRNFVKSCSPKLKSLIRLVKHWYKTYVKGRNEDIPLPHKYALELLTIYAWEQGSGAADFRMDQGFCTVLSLLCQYQKLCIYWTKYYDFHNPFLGDHVRKQLRKPKPVILDPADPTGTVGLGARWDVVAAEAGRCLKAACCQNGLSPIQAWNVQPARPVELTVKLLSGSVLTMTVNPWVYVSQIKVEIQQKWNMSTYEQRLSIQAPGGGCEILQDGHTLADYGLFWDTTVVLLKTEPQEIQIFVKNTDGRTHTYQVRPSITVRELKQKLYHHLHIPVDQQRLSYSSRELEDSNTLAYYHISNESTLLLLLRLKGGANIRE